MADNSIAEELVMALGEALIRRGLLDTDDLIDAAERVQAAGSENAATVAHALNCMVVAAAAPSASEWKAEQRRSQLRVVKDE